MPAGTGQVCGTRERTDVSELDRTPQRRADRRRAPSGRRTRGRAGRAGMGWVVAAAVLVLVIVVGTLAALWLFGSDAPASAEKGSEVLIEVRSGAGTAEIGAELADSGVVANANLFRVIARVTGADGTFKAGTYTLTVGLGYQGAIDALQAGPRTSFVTVTFPEGLTTHQIATLLESKTGIAYADFTALAHGGAPQFASTYAFLDGAYDDSLEGYLYPDTYQIDVDATAEDVVVMMLDRFAQVWDELDKPGARTERYTTNELVTIASLVEREASLDKERPLVASVIDNRLAKHMKLQFCSTVQFLLPGEEERTKVRLTNADLAIDSPYNTYLHGGLPPGPIANPGRKALRAALEPAETTYLYFVLTGKDGSQTFATTAAEFARAKALSKEVLGE